MSPIRCPVCDGLAQPHDVVDFNKSCEESRGKYLPLAGVPIYYFLCGGCGFCFAPEFRAWTLDDFEARIYNDNYTEIDPDYLDTRPRANANWLMDLWPQGRPEVAHLDFGGGGGLLSAVLRDNGWKSESYDPFVDLHKPIEALGKYDLVTAFEVFEHVPDVNQLVVDLATLLQPDGVVVFSTLISEGGIAAHRRLDWWYASPRNGHISLFSSKSLAILGGKVGFQFGSMSKLTHVYCRKVPPWAQHFLTGAPS